MIASDNAGGGKAAFDALKQLTPMCGKVLVISVKPGISTTDARVKGFEDAVNADPSFSYVGVQFSNNEPSLAAQLTTAALQKDPDIVGIFATNLFSAEGTATGIRQAGKQDQVKIVGFDAGPAQVKALKEGTVQALVAQQPATIGEDGVAQAILALDGKPTEKKIQTGFSIITSRTSTRRQGRVYKSSESCSLTGRRTPRARVSAHGGGRSRGCPMPAGEPSSWRPPAPPRPAHTPGSYDRGGWCWIWTAE